MRTSRGREEGDEYFVCYPPGTLHCRFPELHLRNNGPFRADNAAQEAVRDKILPLRPETTPFANHLPALNDPPKAES